MKFLIENQFPKHDFEFELWSSQDYYKWYRPNDEFIIDVYGQAEPSDKHCPVGSVEYVVNYYQKYWDLNIKPKNVPECFINDEVYTGRKVINYSPNTDISFFDKQELHIKSNECIKKEYSNDWKEHHCQVSQMLYDIDSEYRCFVFRNTLKGIQYYSGDFTIFPDIETIHRMIKHYAPYAPIAYTLDVMVRNEKTYIVEVHDFFSCGLYGFHDISYPIMLYRSFYNLVKEKTWQMV